ncbi:hypothetical protein [Pseudonocardia sp. GCM10023141]|uniref:hypothetical protein n=1 Tax=Pseudonocardia sp. GCM10023141 TaxID=3252653 RepID=UPI0036075648
MNRDVRRLAIGSGVAVAAFVAFMIVGARNSSTSPDRVITCGIVHESVSDGDTWTTWSTDRCGVLYAPEGVGTLFDGAYRKAIDTLDEGKTYRIRVHDVHKLLSERTHVVEVEAEVPVGG